VVLVTKFAKKKEGKQGGKEQWGMRCSARRHLSWWNLVRTANIFRVVLEGTK
jgi:hypothetical protein